MRPGGKLPKLPPWLADGHVENSRAASSKDFSPLEIIFISTLASPSDSTKMCRAVALMASGGAPYSSFEKALEMPSKRPMPSCDDDEDCATTVLRTCTEFAEWRNADVVVAIKTRHNDNSTKTAREGVR
eukprot:CAMPEP_0116099146 /NCGR_PEP_ID=MMETSP0327-20121206/11610_1 /TAXON_ID=44447 /ORGANISM="Pseudo-nitzschia delicatissima, Strain B596" /LENGTH=128 /DNA_ID=CAMNT_0003590999 /DNA_START=447 /DNA_END=833 /DNA_ORIENTATION=+